MQGQFIKVHRAQAQAWAALTLQGLRPSNVGLQGLATANMQLPFMPLGSSKSNPHDLVCFLEF